MSADSLVPLPTHHLVERLIEAERTCMMDWLRVLEAESGNPFGVAIREFGQATALLCRELPGQVFNRVFRMTVADAAHIPDILAFYKNYRVTPVFDLSPYGTPPFWVQPNVLTALVQHGLYHGAFHQLLYAVPTMDVPPTPNHMIIQEVGSAETARFVEVYEQVWGTGSAVRVLVGQPHFRCYLASVDGIATALGVLHIANGIGYMQYALTLPSHRSRGCQTALLYRRMHDSAVAGCDLLVSQCLPGTSSQSNQLRTGFHIAGSKAWWLPFMPAA